MAFHTKVFFLSHEYEFDTFYINKTVYQDS